MSKRMALTLLAVLGLVAQNRAQEPVQPAPAQPGPPATTVQTAPGIPAGADGAVIVQGEPEVPGVFAPTGPLIDGAGERVYANIDYLFGWLRSRQLPPLVTTSPPGTPLASAGVLGQNTQVLFGSSNAGGDLRPGVRLGGGGWFDNYRTLGVDMGMFMLGSQNDLFFASGSGSQILARPFFDAASANMPVSHLIAFPGLSTGSVVGSAQSNNLYGAHVDFQEVFLNTPRLRLISLLGYRFLRFDDNLNMSEDLTSLGAAAVVPGTRIQAHDSFSAHNEYHGIDMGLRGEIYADRWMFGFLAKVAYGYLDRDLNIGGQSIVTVPGMPAVTSPGGLLALSSNSGHHNSYNWEAVPEVGATIGWNLTANVRLRAGYSCLWWTGVARASDQVNLSVNPTLLSPAGAGASPQSPSFQLSRSVMWVQTVNLGLEFRY